MTLGYNCDIELSDIGTLVQICYCNIKLCLTLEIRVEWPGRNNGSDMVIMKRRWEVVRELKA